ncbi:MAG: hypothetical protein WCB04_10840 [Mycobacteriales bacterium]
MRMWVAVTLLVLGLSLGFAVTASPSWISIGMLGTSLFIGGAAGLTIAVLGRMSRARREIWQASGPWLLAAGLTLWLALHPIYVKDIDLLSLGFIMVVCGLVATVVAAYLVAPWRGQRRGAVRSWLRPPQSYDPDQTRVMQQPPAEKHW